MGMFDEIHFAQDMPGDPKPKSSNFQTKDMNCWLDHYFVHADGSLWKSEWDSDTRAWTDRERVIFHGMLRFYTLEHIQGSGQPGREDSWWFEYEAKFTDGMLHGIEPVEIRLSRWGEKAEELRNAVQTSTSLEQK